MLTAGSLCFWQRSCLLLMLLMLLLMLLLLLLALLLLVYGDTEIEEATNVDHFVPWHIYTLINAKAMGVLNNGWWMPMKKNSSVLISEKRNHWIKWPTPPLTLYFALCFPCAVLPPMQVIALGPLLIRWKEVRVTLATTISSCTKPHRSFQEMRQFWNAPHPSNPTILPLANLTSF